MAAADLYWDPPLNNRQRYGRHPEVAGRQKRFPKLCTRAVSRKENGGWRQRATTCGSNGNFEAAIASLSQVFISIDALDECLPKFLQELFESLQNIVRDSSSTRIFLTGRPQTGIQEEIQRCFPKAAVIPVSPITDDIRNYLEMRLDRDPESDVMSSDLGADIVRVILEKRLDMWVRPFCIFIQSMVYTYRPLCIDFSLFRSSSTSPNIPKNA